MKGNQQIIDQLNLRLIEELTAIDQYKNNKSIFDIIGYSSLSSYIQERIEDEQKHFDLLIARIRFLEGSPVVGNINEVKTAQDVKQIHTIDRASEFDAIQKYNETIRLCISLGDNGTRLILESILSDEEDHIRDLEGHLMQIQQIGLQNYLSAKI